MEERETSAVVARYLLCIFLLYIGSEVSAKAVVKTTHAEASEEQNALQQALLLVELLKLEYARVLRENNEILRTNEFEQSNILRQDNLMTCAATNVNPSSSYTELIPIVIEHETEKTFTMKPLSPRWSGSRKIQHHFPSRRWHQYAPHNGYNLYYDIPVRRNFNNDYDDGENARRWRKFSYEDPFGPQPGNPNLPKTSTKKSTNSPTYTTLNRETSTIEKLNTLASNISDSVMSAREPSTSKGASPGTKPPTNINVYSFTSTSGTSTTNEINKYNHTAIKSNSSSTDKQKLANNEILNLRPIDFVTTTASTSRIITTSPTIAYLTKRLSYVKKDISRNTINVNLAQNVSPLKPASLKKLSHKINNQVSNEPELLQVAAELENELNANFGKPFSTTNSISRKIFFSWPGTTKIYLARSSRYPIPLPENNAFCHSNPESALCRTFI